MRKRVEAFISALDEEPLPIVVDGQLLTISGNDVRSTFIPGAYSPLPGFPLHARLLAEALAGNLTLLTQRVLEFSLPSLREACSLPSPDGSADPLDRSPQAAIACSDAEVQAQARHNASFLASYAAELRRQSPTFGPMWAQIRTVCMGWKVRPQWRFDGPFVSPPADPSLKEGVPAAPLLLLTSELDPVTPLANAWLVSGGHPGSSVVVQDSVGHCAIATGWSEATNRILRDYFATGVVPPNGTRTHSICEPWSGCSQLEATELEAASAWRRGWPSFPLMI